MLHPTHKFGLAVILVGLLLVPNSMWGQKGPKPAIKDEAQLFSEKAIEEASLTIAKIKEKHQKDLGIETLDKGPPTKEALKWAQGRAKSLGLDGIYIVITKEPRHFEVLVNGKTLEAKLFTLVDRDELAKILKGNLGKNADEALLKVASYTLETMNKRTTAKPPSEFAQLIGEWVGPSVEVSLNPPTKMQVIAKGQLYLRFSEIRQKQFVDLGFYIASDKGEPIGLFRNCAFELKEDGKQRQIVIHSANGKEDAVLTYALADDTLTVMSAGMLLAPHAAGPVEANGDWKRLVRK
jgi:hypothetical protein